MALDRRITVRIGVAGSGRNVFGEAVETTELTRTVLAARRYTVRWFKALALANITDVGVIDEFGHNWNAENITESDARRRLIYIETVRQVVE